VEVRRDDPEAAARCESKSANSGQLTDEMKVDEPVAWACARDREGRSRVFGSSEQSENGRSSRSALRSREDPTSEIDEAKSHCPYNGHHEKA